MTNKATRLIALLIGNICQFFARETMSRANLAGATATGATARSFTLHPIIGSIDMKRRGVVQVMAAIRVLGGTLFGTYQHAILEHCDNADTVLIVTRLV